MIKEIWKDIAEYTGIYMISNYGRIKSLSRKGCVRDRILKAKMGKNGYQQIILCKNGILKSYLVHRLVLEAFIGSCPIGMESCHNKGNTSNNFIGNLRWDTKKSNKNDSKIHGKLPDQKGSKNNNAKLNEWKIRIINRLLEDGCLTQKEIGKIFKISQTHISDIKNRKKWRFIQ